MKIEALLLILAMITLMALIWIFIPRYIVGMMITVLAAFGIYKWKYIDPEYLKFFETTDHYEQFFGGCFILIIIGLFITFMPIIERYIGDVKDTAK